MKGNTKTEDPPTQPPREDSDRKEKFPKQNKSNQGWEVRTHLRQPESQTKVRVMQIVKRMSDAQRRQVVRAEIFESRHPQLDQSRTEISDTPPGKPVAS